MVMYILQQKCENSQTPFTMTINTLEHIENENKRKFRKIQRYNCSSFFKNVRFRGLFRTSQISQTECFGKIVNG